MKVIAYDHFKAGTNLRAVESRLLQAEMIQAWKLWKEGVIRELYGRADGGGGVIVFECESVDEAKRYVEDLPLSRAGFLEWDFLPLTAPTPLEALFVEGAG
jgi:hypothetical protein